MDRGINASPSAIDLLSRIALAFFVLSIPAAHATDPAKTTAPETTTEQDASPRLGPFALQGQIELSTAYDSNIFSLRREPLDDILMIVAPSLSGATDWERHQLGWSMGAVAGRHNEFSGEDYEDYWVDGKGRYDLDDHTNLFGGLSYAYQHEDRGSPSALVAGDEPTTFTSLTAHAGIGHDIGELQLRVGATFEGLDFDDNGLSVGGIAVNDLRDREHTGLGGRITWPVNDTLKAYGQLTYDHRSYDLAASSGRDSSGYQAGGGVLARLGNRLHAEAYLGVLHQDYDAALFDTVSTIDFGGELSWLPSRTTRVRLALDRTLEETTLAGSSSYLYTSLDASVMHRLRPGISAHAQLGLARAAYQDVDRDDDYYTAEIGLRYDLDRRWYLSGSYRISQRDSSTRIEVDNSANLQKTEDFDRELVSLTLGARLGPAEPWPQGERFSSFFSAGLSSPWSGFYAGLALGHDLLGFETIGQRAGGIDKGPYASADLSLGAFGGYGIARDAWFLGLEAEIMGSEAGFSHYKTKPTSRVYKGEAESTYALSLRPGFVAEDGSLLYARLGLVESEFMASVARNDEPLNAFRQDIDAGGLRYGIGADIPASDTLFLRLDYSHTHYDDVSIDLVSETERWEPRRDLFQLGLGWRFGPGNRNTPAMSRPVPQSGPYFGASLVRSVVMSEVDGVHNESGGSFDFYGEFGRGEFSGGGAFLGYAWIRDRWLFAVETGLDAGDAGWTHVRTVGGRNFSVTREGSRELALRLGYYLPNRTLLYARAGQVWTRFNTTWVKGSDAVNDVARDDDVNGFRLGIGAEINLSERVFTRLEYGYTEYDKYGFTTTHGRSDEMDFDNSEGVFRVGLGVRL
jgi:opacity protein-like surface antigen